MSVRRAGLYNNGTPQLPVAPDGSKMYCGNR